MNELRLLWNLYTLKRNERKTREELAHLQEKKLRRMLLFAYGHSGYYHKAFEAAGITSETIHTAPLTQFPVLSKAELFTHFDKLITVPDVNQEEMRRFDAEETGPRTLLKGSCHVVHSSGSTGKPGYFVYDEAAWNHMLLGILRGRCGRCPCRKF